MIVSAVRVQHGLEQSADLNFPLVRFCLAADHFVYVDNDLVLVAECTEFSAQKPVLVFGLCTIEVFGRTRQHALVHCALSLGSHADVVLAVYDKLIDDVIAIYSLLTGCCLCRHSVL